MSLAAKASSKSGDTIVETIFAVAIFAALSVMAIHTMNNGLQQAQRALETTMARNAIDAQAEALRFVHNAYVAEHELDTRQQQFSDIWKKINTLAVNAVANDVNNINTCTDLYGSDATGSKTVVNGTENAFILNPRFIMPKSARSNINNVIASAGASSFFVAPSLYPRIVYTGSEDAGSSLNEKQASSPLKNIRTAEGLWIIAVKSDAQEGHVGSTTNQYYDFYIQTCWQSLSSQAPSTLTTIVRLYNPEIVNR